LYEVLTFSKFPGNSIEIPKPVINARFDHRKLIQDLRAEEAKLEAEERKLDEEEVGSSLKEYV
jgi:hypothetical protein